MASQPFVSLAYGNPVTNRCPRSPKQTSTSTTSNNTTHVINTNASSIEPIVGNPANLPATFEPFGALFYTIMCLQLVAMFLNGSSTAFVDIAVLRKAQLAEEKNHSRRSELVEGTSETQQSCKRTNNNERRKQNQQPVSYGRQRFFGAFGVIIGVTVMSTSFDVFLRGASITCYASIFPIYVVFTLCYIVSAMFLYKGLSFENNGGEAGNLIEGVKGAVKKNISTIPTRMDEDKKNKEEEFEQDEKENIINVVNEIEKETGSDDDNTVETSCQDHFINTSDNRQQIYYKTLRHTLTRFDTVVFFLTVLVVGFVNAPIFLFLLLWIQDLGAPPSSPVYPLTFVVAALSGSIGYFFDEAIMKKLGGPLNTILVAVFAYAVRLWGTALIEDPWLVLPFQGLHLITFALFMTASLKQLNRSCPVTVLSTLTSVYRSIFEALASILSSTVGGAIMNSYGTRKMFMFYGWVAATWGVLFGVYVFIKRRHNNKNNIKNKKLMAEME